MPLSGEAKKIYQREYMKRKRSNGNKPACQACGSKVYIHAHHPDYSKPLQILWVCASCHKKLHLCLTGKQRTTSKPYINPLDKIAKKLEAQGIKVEGNRIVIVSKQSPIVKSENVTQTEPTQPNLPICDEYNFKQFKPGDKVLMRRGKRLIEAVIPELDAEGNPIPTW